MGDPQTSAWWQEIVYGLAKGVMWLVYIILGVMAKLAFDSRNSKLTRRQIVIKSLLSIFAGYMAAVTCEHFDYRNFAKLVVPVATLLGESIIIYIMTNWQKLAEKALPYLKNKEK